MLDPGSHTPIQTEILDPLEVNAHLRSCLHSHTAVKIKLGKPTMAEDVARVAAVRRAIGENHTLMVDANMGYSVAEGIRMW